MCLGSFDQLMYNNAIKKIAKFIYSEKATKFCKIFTLLLTGTTYDKSKVKISKFCDLLRIYELYKAKFSKLLKVYETFFAKVTHLT